MALVALLAGSQRTTSERAAQLERALVQERIAAATLRHAASIELQRARARSQSLEDDLGAVEEEAERLYEIVRAMRTLGEQLRERVGLSGPIIEPLPELPPRPPGPEQPRVARIRFATTSGQLDRGAAIEHAPADGSPVNPEQTALPPNTGPWPDSLTRRTSVPERSARLAYAAQVVAQQWDAWQQLGQAIDLALDQRMRAARPSTLPASGPITSGFGWRPGFWGILAFHTGVDISLPIGTAVFATADGMVSFSGERPGYGSTVEIQHAGGLLTLDGHLSRPLVRAGQPVAQGQIIALSGNSGVSTGPHLHYEVRLNGAPVDPTRYW